MWFGMIRWLGMVLCLLCFHDLTNPTGMRFVAILGLKTEITGIWADMWPLPNEPPIPLLLPFSPWRITPPFHVHRVYSRQYT